MELGGHCYTDVNKVSYYMKRFALLIGIAALAFTSCEKDQIKDVNRGHAIDFRVAAQSRAMEITTENLTTFYVTALDQRGSNYFTDVAFTKIEEYFSSSPSYFWPGDGSSLDFYAYAPSTVSLGADVTIDSDTQTLSEFSPAAEISEQKDFVSATATGSKADQNDGVALTFNHQLAQIEVKARNANEGYIYKVRGVRIAQPISKADFDFTTSQWSLDPSSKAVYQVQYDNDIILETYGQCIMREEGDNAMLIPQQLVPWDSKGDKANESKGAYLSVYAQVSTKSGSRIYPKSAEMDYAWMAVPIDTKWEAGYKYVYTLDFTNGAGHSDPIDGPADEILGDPISFLVQVTPWNDKQMHDPIVGIWHINKVHFKKFDIDGTTVLEEWTMDSKEEIEDENNGLPYVYHEFEFINSTDFYYREAPDTQQFLMNTTLDGNKRVLDMGDGSVLAYLEFDPSEPEALTMVIKDIYSDCTEEIHLYYEKTK